MKPLKRLKDLEAKRASLTASLRQFDRPPQALQITVNKKSIKFSIRPETGKVDRLPDIGVWGWARNLRWQDLKKFLEEKGYTVKVRR